MAKRFYGMDVRGKFWPERLASEPVWTPDDEGRVFYDEAVEGLKFGTASKWSNAGSYNDVPLNTILLIESDVQLTGYSLLTNKDDMTVYITKGSGAAGEAGGTDKAGGTWEPQAHIHSQSAHTHPVSSHTHGISSGTVPGAAAHTHPPQSGYGNFMSSSGSTHGEAGDSYGTFLNTGSNVAGATSHNHGGVTVGGVATATSGGGENTGAIVTPVNTWRPKGRNFTRQQRI